MSIKVSLALPPHSDELQVSIPEEHVLLLTFNRPASLNAMSPTLAKDIASVLEWFDDEPSLWVVIVTGAGRTFCAGADLKALVFHRNSAGLLGWNNDQQSGTSNEQESTHANLHGFGSISRRHTSCKPMIAAVNGSAYGGGVEMILNCDIVVASKDAKFGLPEVKRGVLAVQGAIPRLSKIAGHQFASEMLLLGNPISASEAQARYRFVNAVVPKAEVLPKAIQVARQIVQNSPDSVQSTKRALVLSQTHSFEGTVLTHNWSPETTRLYKGENIKEGLQAFRQKRPPVWRNPAKL